MNYYQIAMRFPTLRRMIEAEFPGKDAFGQLAHQIDPIDFFSRAQFLSIGGRSAADFVLHLYNSAYYTFNLRDAMGRWDSEHRAAFLATMLEEWPSTARRSETTENQTVRWIVTEENDPEMCGNGEFGVEVNGVPFFYYKWSAATPSEGVKYRVIEKREFGEVIRRPVKRDHAAEHTRICGVISALNAAGANISVSTVTIAKAIDQLPFVQGQD